MEIQQLLKCIVWLLVWDVDTKKNVTSDDETVPTNDKNVKDACVNHICNMAGAAAKNSCQFWQVSKGSWL